MKHRYQITRKMLKPGFEFNHLGMIYRVLRFNHKRDVVKVENPLTGFQGEYNYKLIRLHSRLI